MHFSHFDLLQEQEARSDLLRKRARQRLDIPSGSGDTTVLSHVDVSAAVSCCVHVVT